MRKFSTTNEFYLSMNNKYNMKLVILIRVQKPIKILYTFLFHSWFANPSSKPTLFRNQSDHREQGIN